MATQVQYRRGTTAEHAAFTGAQAEITVDTTKNSLVVHDGVTAGGHPLAKVSDLTAHTDDPTAAHAASAISVVDTGARFISTDVEGCLAEAYDKATASSINYFTEVRNTAAPNATVPAHQWAATGAETNIDAVLSPKGSGSILAAIPDNLVSGGNKRGTYATDLQNLRTVNSQVASGSLSVIGGGNSNAAIGNNSTVAGGASNLASGVYSVVSGGNLNISSSVGAVVSGGDNNIADGAYSVVSGGIYGTVRGIYGRQSYASGRFATTGDSQLGTHPQRVETTSAVAAILTGDGSLTPTTSNVAVLPNSHAYSSVAYITARSTAGDIASWKIEGAIKRGAGAATTALVGTPAITTIAKDAGASTWAVAMVANTTRGSVEIQVTGAAATTIHWMCKLDTVEVG